MELAERYKAVIIEFEKAFNGFEQGLAIDLSRYSAQRCQLSLSKMSG